MIEALQLSVGRTFDYPLLGGETFYDMLYVFNNTFGLTLNKKHYDNATAVKSKSDKHVTLTVHSKDFTEWYTFKNMSGVGVPDIEEIGSLQKPKTTIVFHKPFHFVKEMDFLKTIPINIMVNCYGADASVSALYHYLCATSPLPIAHQETDKIILRYLGTGDKVPSIYGVFDAKQFIAIIELKRQNSNSLHCLRNRIYHVYNNGYRSRD